MCPAFPHLKQLIACRCKNRLPFIDLSDTPIVTVVCLTIEGMKKDDIFMAGQKVGDGENKERQSTRIVGSVRIKSLEQGPMHGWGITLHIEKIFDDVL
jgi:cytochrome c-type biogenesis protein CcmE